MELDHRNPWNRLVQNEALLLDQFRVTEDVLLTLSREKLITTEELDRIRALQDRTEKIRALLFDVLQYQDPALFPVFCDLLRKSKQDDMADLLDDDEDDDNDELTEEECGKGSVEFGKRHVGWNEEYLTSLAKQVAVTFTLVLVFVVILVFLDVQP